MTAVSLLRISTVAGALTAAVTTVAPAADAQPYRGEQLITGAITVEPDPRTSSGYFGIGSGLARAIAEESSHGEVAASPRKRKTKAAAHTARPVVRETVASLVADTLDPTGLNIARLGLERR